MFKRVFNVPRKTFFLLGPRGTGKSTWLRKELSDALYLDLLKSSLYLELKRNPSVLHDLVGHLKAGQWVVVDEIQRIPELLNEVHALYEEKRLQFVLSGSSARKLKRGAANLLGGRALTKLFFPFIYPEYKGRVDLREILKWGSLPIIVTEPQFRKDTLYSYVETYLRQELLEEGLIRKLDSFVRYLGVAGIMNGQVLNLQNISRESAIGRSTVQGYFEILIDTLIGFYLPAYQAGAKVKEAGHPKFYFFDAGVARACAGTLDDSLGQEQFGFLFETQLLNEIRAYNHYSGKNRALYYYGISGSYEIDLVVEVRRRSLAVRPELVCIEFKASKKWDSRWSKPLQDFANQKKAEVKATYGVYLGDQILSFRGVTVLPVEKFLETLHSGDIF